MFTICDEASARREINWRCPPYRSHIDWLQQQDFSKTEAFWRQTLKDFGAHRWWLIISQAGETAERQGDQKSGSRRRSHNAAFAGRENQLTLAQWCRCWALLLSRYSGEADGV
jgi:hypothetical protein